MSVNKNLVISVKGYKNQLDSKNKYQINEDTIIELKGDFRSAGKIKSIIYFGLKCFKENGTEIERVDINRINEHILIASLKSNNEILLHKTPEKWNNKDDSYSETYSKFIGFYFDGNVNHLPDLLLKYKNYENNLVHLYSTIPEEISKKIIPYVTRVMNHNVGNGSFYDYSAACGEEVPEQWTEYKAIYKGFSNGYGDIKGKFRLGTRIVSPFVICNYGQNQDAVLEIRNVVINVKDEPKFILN